MGHVFVVQGDLMALGCDAWSVSGSHGPGGTWRRALPPSRRRLEPPASWGTPGSPRAYLLAEVDPPAPLPFLTDIVQIDDRLGTGWWVDGARDFVRVAAETLAARGRVPACSRERHLLALPLLGTGGGGGAHVSGELLRPLLAALREEAQRARVDVALVLIDGPAWAAAQRVRQTTPGGFEELPPDLCAAADRLAGLARAGDLVLFLGAGVSRGAGLPGWGELLTQLLRIDDPGERAALDKLGELDRAEVIRRRLGGEPIGVAVARIIKERSVRHGLGHALLASLPVDEIVTTNYDELFERASAGIGRPCAILPGRSVTRGDRWILKMHGGVDAPETIVLTRDDYLRYQENRSALLGIVQALLLTRHMLFVGFSLTDDNFHRIAHAVRKALGARQGYGTTLVVDPNPLARELWRDELQWVAFDQDAGGAPRPLAVQTRLLEIFLDRLACQAATATGHLGDRRYDGALAAGERALRDRLEGLAAATTAAERASDAWAEVERLLRRLGIHPR